MDENNMVLCSLTAENKKENAKKKFGCRGCETALQGWYDLHDADTSYSFTRNTWIGHSGALCHITNDDTGLYDITDID